MHIDNLRITKLYGSLSKFVTFPDSLNLLVGINGSGKTSILNVIDWLLRPNMPRLAVTSYDRLRLTVTHNSQRTVIEATQKNNILRLSVTVGKKRFHPLTVNLAGTHDVNNVDIEEEERLIRHYSHLSPDKKEKITWDFLMSMPKPVVISLDRTISAEEDSTFYREPEVNPRSSPLRARAISPLVRVQDVTTTRFAQYRSEVIELNNRLKNRIILSAFDDSGVRGTKLPETPPLVSASEIDALERKVLNQLSLSVHDRPAANTIKTYFRRLKRFLGQIKKPSDEVIYSKYFAERFRMIDGLARAFKDFETRSTQAYVHLRKYLDTVNSFLQDSSKRLMFNDSTNRLFYSFIDSAGQSVGPEKRIEHLSSGERQIVILLTFLTFVADDERVFIIDEPELSLHPKWQKEFLDAILTLKHKNTQVLLATHSPEIVGGHKESCIVL